MGTKEIREELESMGELLREERIRASGRGGARGRTPHEGGGGGGDGAGGVGVGGASSSSSGKKKAGGGVREEGPRDPTYRDVIVTKFPGNKGLLEGKIFDVRAR
ncbi:hypothetical protein ACHAW5_006653 [Stephanodiscus triporus]|uniref:Uncharacterized protein n=1 Tax=Stephanodiscus triporus TaxID=2934178 RepID=A0ABD3N4C4_9STRA